MKTDLSRRAFLKGAAAAACTAAASAAPASAAFGRSNDRDLATLIDIRKCVGCEACVEACRESNAAKYPEPKKPFPKMFPARVKAEDWSGEDRREVRDRLTPYNWLYIQHAEVTHEGEEYSLTIPRRCMHCQNPPCADLCPWGAARKLENGITRIHSDICLGGKKCQVVCPWKIPQRQTGVGLYLDILPRFAGNGVMYKCDRCYQRVAEGELPACIAECPENVQEIGPRAQILEKAKKIAADIGGFLYGADENGGTNTIYVSPVPFEKLNAAVEKGPGHTHFAPVEDQMAHADNLAKALLIAPFAGVAAGFARFYRKVGSVEEKAEK